MKGLQRYIIRRSLQSIFLLWAISVISFTLMHIAPGGPVQFIEDPRLSQKHLEELERALGLDQPLPIQYFKWLWRVVQLDFGKSYDDRRPVIEKIAERIPASVQLALAGMILGLVVGIPLGFVCALKRGSWLDNTVRVLTVIGNAVPHWWLGLILILVFSFTFRIFPSGRMYTLGRGDILDRLWHIVLPATISALGGWITYSRFMRYEVVEVLHQDYVRTALAKGLPWRVVLSRHVLRNAILPIVTMMGGILTIVISGSVLFERVFSWPGMGRMAYEAIGKRDYPLLMAILMISSFLVIAGNLLADIAYSFVDPRVKYE